MKRPVKEIVVISGKGGTGKTSLIASFISLAGNCVISDCDVDAADLHILLHPDIKKEEEFYALEIADIDEQVCDKCGQCVENCRFNAITDYRVDPKKCEGCAVCQIVCLPNAISMHPKSVGKIYTSETRYGKFIHGKLEPGSSNSGRMVAKLREMAKREAEKSHTNLILIDGSPGIGCPVISSITGTDMVLAVAEPTLSGIHDLKRVLALTEHFKTNCSIIINKCDINEVNCEFIENLCKQHNMPLLGKIPYSISFTKSIIAGKPLVEYAGNGVSGKVEEIWEKARELF